MKRHIYIAAFLFLSFSISYSQAVKKFIEKSKTEVEAKGIDVLSIDKNKDGKVFQCPMDWAVLSDKPGNCDICKMKLKEYSVQDARDNLDKFLRSSKKHKHEDNKEMHEGIKVWNSVCPLDGKEIAKGGATSEFKGKKIGFCSKDCKVAFDKKPEKYMKNLSIDGKKFIAKK